MKKKCSLLILFLLYSSLSLSEQLIKCPDKIICENNDDLNSCTMRGGNTEKWKFFYFPYDLIRSGEYIFNSATAGIRSAPMKYATACAYVQYSQNARITLNIKNDVYEVVPNTQQKNYWREVSNYYSCEASSADYCLMIIKNQ